MKNFMAESKRIGKHLAKMSLTPNKRRPQADIDIVGYQIEGQTKRLKRVVPNALRKFL